MTEISWGVVQNNGQPYMQPGIKTELTLEHSEGEEFVNEQDRKKTGLETVRQKVRLQWQIRKCCMQMAAALLEGASFAAQLSLQIAAAHPDMHHLRHKLDLKQLLPILQCIICRLILPANGCCPARRACFAAQA